MTNAEKKLVEDLAHELTKFYNLYWGGFSDIDSTEIMQRVYSVLDVPSNMRIGTKRNWIERVSRAYINDKKLSAEAVTNMRNRQRRKGACVNGTRDTNPVFISQSKIF